MVLSQTVRHPKFSPLFHRSFSSCGFSSGARKSPSANIFAECAALHTFLASRKHWPCYSWQLVGICTWVPEKNKLRASSDVYSPTAYLKETGKMQQVNGKMEIICGCFHAVVQFLILCVWKRQCSMQKCKGANTWKRLVIAFIWFWKHLFRWQMYP